jgi:hypothetical protein
MGELRINKPKLRLKNFTVGQSVILIGADIYFRPFLIGIAKLYIGKVEGGYSSLWTSKAKFDSGSLPDVVAAASHEVEA